MTKQELVQRVLTLAAQQIGVKENPPSSNKVKFNDWFFNQAGYVAEWCGTSVSWIFSFAGLPLGNIGYLRGYSGCGTAVSYLLSEDKSKHWGTIVKPEEMEPGDIFFIDFDGNGSYDHTGITSTSIDANGDFHTFEGNTSEKGSQSNGGMYIPKNRNISHGKFLFVRPNCYANNAH